MIQHALITRAVARSRAGPAWLCARVWARIPRLLGPRELERLRSAGDLAGLFHLLRETDYAPHVEQAVLDPADLDELDRGLVAALAARVEQVRQWVEDSVPQYRYLVVGQWDCHHLLAVTRRLLIGSDRAVASKAYVPVGAWTPARYSEALAAETMPDLLRSVEHVMPEVAARMGSFLAEPREHEPGLREIELFLDELHLGRMLACARAAVDRTDARLLRKLIAWEADLLNLRTALRLLGRRLPATETRSLWLAHGSLGREQFLDLMGCDEIEQLYRLLPRGPLAVAVERGMLGFVSQGRASVFERCFDIERLRLRRRLARLHRVSVVVPLLYLARANNELVNVRMIARGIRYGLPTGRVQENLVDG